MPKQYVKPTSGHLHGRPGRLTGTSGAREWARQNRLGGLQVVVRRRLYPEDIEDRRCDLPGITLIRTDMCREGGAAEQRETFRPMIARALYCLLSADSAESF